MNKQVFPQRLENRALQNSSASKSFSAHREGEPDTNRAFSADC
jgi:hypothetical protein